MTSVHVTTIPLIQVSKSSKLLIAAKILENDDFLSLRRSKHLSKDVIYNFDDFFTFYYGGKGYHKSTYSQLS